MTSSDTSTTSGSPHSQTLSRGIQALEILSDSVSPMSIAELSEALGVHRSITYRILRTLEDHSLVMRDSAGHFHGAPGLATLARGVSRDLQSAALPELATVANTLGMTAFIAVWDKSDCVTLLTVEPRNAGAVLAQRPGSRHPFNTGAPGIAIQSLMTEDQWTQRAPELAFRPEAHEAARRGYAITSDEVMQGVTSISAPIRVPGQAPVAIAVVYIRTQVDPAEIGNMLKEKAQIIEALLR